MDKIKCQAKHDTNGGCRKCGSYGHLLEKNTCPSCGHEYWDYIRSGTTVYNGKKLDCFDGTVITWMSGGKSTCSKCEG